MASFIPLIAICLAAANFVLSYGSYLGPEGLAWADHVCSVSAFFCENPQQLNYLAAGLAGTWVAMKLVSALRN